MHKYSFPSINIQSPGLTLGGVLSGDESLVRGGQALAGLGGELRKSAVKAQEQAAKFQQQLQDSESAFTQAQVLLDGGDLSPARAAETQRLAHH